MKSNKKHMTNIAEWEANRFNNCFCPSWHKILTGNYFGKQLTQNWVIFNALTNTAFKK